MLLVYLKWTGTILFYPITSWGLQTEIMVSVRTSTNQAFSAFLLIGAPNMLPEAATISSDNSENILP